MLGAIAAIRKEASQKLDQGTRSQFGQYMTPKAVAEFMASFFQNNNAEIVNLLDAGAGIGSLTAAFLDGWIRRNKTKKRGADFRIIKFL